MTADASHLAAEIATQPDDWAAVLHRYRRGPGRPPPPGESVAVVGCGTSFFMAQAYAVLREAAGSGVGGRTEAHAASEFPLDRDLRPRRRHLPLGHDDRGHRAPRRPCASAASAPRPSSPPRARRSPSWPPTRCCSPRSTSSRWCRPGSRPPRSACCAPPSARTSSAAIADAEAVLAEDEATALAGVRRRRADHLRRARLDDRAGQRGGAQAARVGPVLDRVLPRDGVPPRPDQHRHHRAGDLGLRRRCPRDWPRTCAPREPTSSTATSTRWPTWCACTASAWSRRHAREWTLIEPRHLSRSIILS